jgi:hypothetical protein
MADTSTIASLATAGGTLILAIATFSSTRSANRAARVSEQALKVGLRPVLFNARPQDPSQKVGYIDNHWLVLRDGLAAVQASKENLYLAIPLRNVAAGLAVLHGWYHEGGQRTVTRFSLTPRTHAREDDEPWLWMCATARHWNLDRADPR